MDRKVVIAGTGPGNPLLINLQLIDEIKSADVILYDKLINKSLLFLAKKNAEIIFVGKSSKVHYKHQFEINDLLVNKYNEGKKVLRLKGGDPFVFGRGGEEVETLIENNIPYKLIPGITSGIAAPEYAGIPVTHRKNNSSLLFVTGHEDPLKKDSAIDWKNIASFNGTIVIYMGVGRLKEISEILIENGKSKDTDIALINNGTLSKQRVITGSLADIYEISLKENIKPPSIIVIGDVVKYRKQFLWYENLPLYNKTVVITRAIENAYDFAKKIWNFGGEVIFYPTIDFQQIDNIEIIDKNICIANETTKEWLVFTSPRGVRFFFEQLADFGKDIRCIGKRKIAAIGDATAKKLKEKGVIADLIPKKFIAESLAEELLTEKPSIVNIIRAETARDALNNILEENSVRVNIIPVYRTIKPENSLTDISEVKSADWFVFTSSSTFNNFIHDFDNYDFLNNKVISIGPVTTSTIAKQGIKVEKEATVFDINGVFTALLYTAKGKDKEGD